MVNRRRHGLAGLVDRHIRLIAHLGALAPLALLVVDALRDDLTVNPIQEATLRTGKPALVLLVLSLACTPLSSVFDFKAVLKVRRALGLYAFLYASIHFAIFVALDYGFNLQYLREAVFEKRYALVGFASGLVLLALAITSFRWWQKRLGKNWKRLHRLAYLAGILAIVHYIWLVKTDIRQPLAWGAILLLLFILRLRGVRQIAARLRSRLATGEVDRNRASL
ncbi:MAG: ferric reductase-like transmembrane domain-containing protein [Anaerolineales bacterium]|nr:ferric reductase-like transmembrane domain-containing protein [Anaerolineales bacterium]